LVKNNSFKPENPSQSASLAKGEIPRFGKGKKGKISMLKFRRYAN
jgi:hypothetical protein